MRGSIVVKTALLLPILVVISGGTIEYSVALRDRALLQSAVDAAAVGAAKELSLTDTKRESLQAVARAIVDGHVSALVQSGEGRAVAVSTKVGDDPIAVDVSAAKKFHSMFGDVLGVSDFEISVRAVARVIGRPNICVLGLNGQEMGTISLEKQAGVTGQNCAVYSNSSHTNGMKAKNSAVLSAAFICTRGGKEGGPGNFTPDPLVDCPEFDDPLADRPEPLAGACDPKQPVVIESAMTLAPGTYCGLTIRNGASVSLLDGVYVFKDQPLIVTDGAALSGKSVGLYFTGNNAYFRFDAKSTISLEAPTSGPMAGLLVFASRSQKASLTYSIMSNDARTLIGTIYIPKGELRIDADSPVADQSAYTAIVADKMRLYGGPHLVLNTDYDQTDVPVPAGIRGAGQPVALSE